jgi:uncharacterized phage protein gp47/JayE
MSGPFGVTPQGFVPMTLTDVKSALEDDARASINANIDLAPAEPMGQLIGIISEQAANVWEAIEDAYHAAIPDDATGASLIALAGLTGTVQNPPRRSTGVETLTGAPNTPVSQGRIVSVLGASASKFQTVADATIAAVPAWQTGHAYALLDRVTNGGAVYQASQTGTSASSGGGPSGTGSAITDNGVIWQYLGPGTGAVDVDVESTVFGAIAGPDSQVTVIETPVSGWLSAINLSDFALGNTQETDASLRQRREQDLRSTGKAALDAIRAALLDIVTDEGNTAITSATVFENNTMATNTDGMPPKSVEALVLQPAGIDVDQKIFETLFGSVAAGITIHGQVSGSVIDSQGVSHTIKFTRPTGLRTYVSMMLTKDPNAYPQDGDVQVRNAIVAYAASAYQVGSNVIPSALSAQAFKVPGVKDVTDLRVGFSSPPTSTTELPVGARQLATVDSGDVQVSSTDYSP